MSLKSPLSKALGKGSAKHGFSHWWWQRISAVLLVPLVLWFVYSLICLIGGDYQSAYSWLATPIHAVLMIVLFIALLFHAQTGLQVVIEDYIHVRWLNISLLLAVKFASVVLCVYAIVSVLRVVLGG